MQFEAFVSRLKHRQGDSYRCPGHDDRNNSLSCSAAADRILVNCHAGCTAEHVVESMGLSVADLFFAPRTGNGYHANGNGKTSAAHLTLEEFASAKGFEPQFLADMGVVEDKGGVVFHYLLMNGQRAARQRIRLSLNGDKKFIWNKNDGHPVPYGLWRLEEARKRGARDLILPEGESDSLTFWSHGMNALGIPGADMCKLLQAPHVAGFSRVLIVRENDRGGGETFEKGCVGQLAKLEFGGEVRVVEMAQANVKDPNDLHVRHLGERGAFESEFDALVEMSRPVELPIVGLELLDASAIQSEDVEWHWYGRIPIGKVVLAVGDPGVGKSFFTLYVAANLSLGRIWPDGAACKPAMVLIFSAEDSPADTIVPRLEALGAQRGMIRIARRVREANEAGEIQRRSFSLVYDLPHIERTLDRTPDIKLVIIDPVTGYMGRTDSHKNAEVRSEILDPLAELAERRKVTILAVSHFNKSDRVNSLGRVSGSIAFPAAARAVWGFARDPEDPGRRLMLFAKSNIGPELQGLAFRISPDQQGRPTLQWIEGEVTQKLDDVLRQEQEAARAGSDEGMLAKATALIQRLCHDGPIPSTTLEEEAAKEGISERTLWRARKLLNCVKEREGYGRQGRWMVGMPK